MKNNPIKIGAIVLFLIGLILTALLFWFSKRHLTQRAGISLQVINQSRWSQTIERAVRIWNQEHPEQPVEIDQLIIGYPQLRSKLITSCGAGTPPDISILDSVWLSEFAQAGHLAALDELDPEWYINDYQKDFFTVFQKGDVFDGHLWGVRTQTDMAILWYRRDWFDNENLAPPQSWEDMVNIAKYFQMKTINTRYSLGRFPLALPLGQKARETLVYQLLPLFWSNNGGILKDGDIILDAEANIQTLEFLKKLVSTYEIVSPEAITFEWNRAMKLIAGGKAAMAFGGTYEKKMIQQAAGWDNQAFTAHIGYTLIPSGPRGQSSTTAGGMCYVIYKNSPHQRLAMEILKLATSPEIMKAFLLETGQHPPRVSIAEELDTQQYPFLAETASYLYKAKTRPNFPEYSRLSDIIQIMVEEVIRGNLTPTEAVNKASEKIRQL